MDAYGPGNSRSSSGGETRIIRMGYGEKEIYTRWAMASLPEWERLDEGGEGADRAGRAGRPLFLRTGFLWMAHDADPLSTATLAALHRAGAPHERLGRRELEARWPQIEFGSVTWAIFEPNSGVVLARRAVAEVVRRASLRGAELRTASALPLEEHFDSARGRLEAIDLGNGDTIRAEEFVFACGPWLPKLFPAILDERIVSTRQEVYYFGIPDGDVRFAPPSLPAWIDFGEEIYGIPDIEARGFKIAVDRHGPRFDPDLGERIASETLDEVRGYLSRRFPMLAQAPVIGAEVCQYENTSDGELLIDRHPKLENVWIVGGGSGHGFKHGPAVGAEVARLVTHGGFAEDRFRLASKTQHRERTVY
jgi:glycine/D-amino acid oxidase-like deaminating enzyme